VLRLWHRCDECLVPSRHKKVPCGWVQKLDTSGSDPWSVGKLNRVLVSLRGDSDISIGWVPIRRNLVLRLGGGAQLGWSFSILSSACSDYRRGLDWLTEFTRFLSPSNQMISQQATALS
jgi:hypothetical protein